MEGHTDRVKAVAFSSDGSRLASGSGDGALRLWDSATGECVRKLGGHTDRVNVVGMRLQWRECRHWSEIHHMCTYLISPGPGVKTG